MAVFGYADINLNLVYSEIQGFFNSSYGVFWREVPSASMTDNFHYIVFLTDNSVQ